VSLLRRKRQPPPLPPDNLRVGVGPGDYWHHGEWTVGLIEQLVGVQRDDAVLDLGCGLGRIAWPLSHRLGWRGRYVGLDAAHVYIEWCEKHLDLPRRFTFVHADLRTGAYNVEGAIDPASWRFPWGDRTFSLVIATSLFTHLLPDACDHYLREIARTLRPDGRLFSSFFMLDEAARAAIAAGTTYPTFTTAIEHGMLHDPAVPEDGVAHEPEWLLARVTAAGLRVDAVHPGSWKTPGGLYYQDLVIARRA